MKRVLGLLIACLTFVPTATARIGSVKAYRAEVNVREQLAAAELVCKGEIVDAPMEKFVTGGNELPFGTGIAVLRIDRCFKGSAQSPLTIAVDELFPAGGISGGRYPLIPKTGDYGLFFLTKDSATYKPIRRGEPILPASKLLSASPLTSYPALNLETDFLAALKDPDEDIRLASTWFLGSLEHITPTAIATLRRLASTENQLQKLFALAALLAAHQYSVLPEAATVLDKQRRMREYSLPRDRAEFMQFRVQELFYEIHDSIVIPYLWKLSTSSDPRTREDTIQALRTHHDLGSADTFLHALHDKELDTGFDAMQSLFELAGTGPDWNEVPSRDDFRTGDWAADKIAEWWNTTGKELAKSKIAEARASP